MSDKFAHDVKVNLVPVGLETFTGDKWRLALDGFELKAVTDVKIDHSFDSMIKLTVTMHVDSVKGFNE